MKSLVASRRRFLSAKPTSLSAQVAAWSPTLGTNVPRHIGRECERQESAHGKQRDQPVRDPAK
jgi:hypothetical protein